MKILVSDNQEHYSKIIKDSEITNNIKEADLVIFTGGADVDPELYGENSGKFTRVNTGRDRIEVMTYKLAQELHIPCLGICRGLN